MFVHTYEIPVNIASELFEIDFEEVKQKMETSQEVEVSIDRFVERMVPFLTVRVLFDIFPGKIISSSNPPPP